MSPRQQPAPRRRSTGSILMIGFGVLVIAVIAAVFLRSTSELPMARLSSGEIGRLEATPAKIDLGQVPFDKQVVASFDLVNTGQGPVRLLKPPGVKTLEGC
jgi:hypothetical protein